MKNFARYSLSAQTANSGSGGNNPEKAVAAIPGCATEFDVGNLKSGPGRLGPDLEIIQAMFDCDRPGRSGGLAGESFAATLERHPRYPNLRSRRHAALLRRLDDLVASHINSMTGILQGLGFDEAGTKIYRSSALRAFRSVLPN
jgi:hypothetical protein